MKCAEVCDKNKSPCEQKDCRMWINYDDDLNCVDIAVKKNGPMGLKQIGARLGISYVRVTQIEKEVLRKIKKTNFSKNDTIYSIE
jgi:hypothetical protein